MLLNDFFVINKIETNGFEIKSELVLYSDHKLFQGHFPNLPVVPGVCMMQMIKEILEVGTKKNTNLIEAVEMKFLAIIDPGRLNNLQAILKYVYEENSKIRVTATLINGGTTYFKFKGLFEFHEPQNRSESK